MPTYIMLNRFTDQGIRTIRDTTKRHDKTTAMAKKFGVTVKGIYWTLGQYDLVGTYDAADEASMTAFALAVGEAGNVQTQVLRAMNKEEMQGVLDKLGKAKQAVPA